jgi:hypothetical protein
MAALVQSYPQQSGTVTLLQTRPTSASAIMSSAQLQGGQPYGPGSSQRHSVHGISAGLGGTVVYRGASAPIQPYAFTNTPVLTPAAPWQHARTSRTLSTPVIPTVTSLDPNNNAAGRVRYPASASMTNLPSTAMMTVQQGGSRDDSALPGLCNRRASSSGGPQFPYLGQAQQIVLAPAAAVRISPERYRRVAPRQSDSATPVSSQSGGSVLPSGSGMASVSQFYNPRNVANNQGVTPRHQFNSLPTRPNSFVGTLPEAFDDMQLPRGYVPEDLKRLRRRSMPTLDSAEFSKPLTPLGTKQPAEWSRVDQLAPPRSADKDQKVARTGSSNSAVDKTIINISGRTGSSDSRGSSHSTPASSRSSSVSGAHSYPWADAPSCTGWCRALSNQMAPPGIFSFVFYRR